MQHTSGLRLNLRRCSAATLFTSEISVFVSAHRRRRAARDYIIAVLCFCFNADYMSLNSVSTSAFKALIGFRWKSQWTCLFWFSAHSEHKEQVPLFDIHTCTHTHTHPHRQTCFYGLTKLIYINFFMFVCQCNITFPDPQSSEAWADWWLHPFTVPLSPGRDWSG